MEIGGTQSYFSEFTDGTLRFLPFDFIREEKLWFGHIRNHRGWLPLNENLSITDLIEWPPSRILGSTRELMGRYCYSDLTLTTLFATIYKYLIRLSVD